MATISTMMQVHDMVSGPMRKMADAMNVTLGVFEQLQAASDQTFDASNFEQARFAIEQVSQELDHQMDLIDKAGQKQDKFNDSIREGGAQADTLTQKLMGAVGAFVGLAAVQKGIGFIQKAMDMSDTVANVDRQLKSVLKNVGATEDAYARLAQTAQSIEGYSLYGGDAMLGAAAELSTYITDTDALEEMMRTTANYAAGMSGGGAVDTKQMVEYASQLGKALGGTFDGLKIKGFELSEAQKEIIENGTDMEKALAISQVIDESWANLAQSMAQTPQGKLIQMQNTFGKMAEAVGRRLYPAVLHLFDTILAHAPIIDEMLMGFSTGIEWIVLILSLLIDAVAAVYTFVADNWSLIAPVVYGIIAALGAYLVILGVMKVAEMIGAGVKIVSMLASYAHAAATGVQASATAAATAAQYGFNTALLACPLVWILLLIIAIIAAIFLVVAVINQVTGSSISAIGIICGSLAVAGAFIGNLFVAVINFVMDIFVVLWNFIAAFANFFGNVFSDPVGAIARLFFDLVDVILSLLQALASAIDTIFGSDLAGSVQGWRDSLGGWVDQTFGKGEEIMAELNAEDLHLGRFEYGNAWDSGYQFGEGVDNAISNFDAGSFFDELMPGTDGYGGYGGAGDIADDIGQTAGNTGAMADALDVTNENLKYLRDLAETEAINRFTTAEIRVKMNNNNTLSSADDVDGVIDRFTEGVQQALETAAEGVHK